MPLRTTWELRALAILLVCFASLASARVEADEDEDEDEGEEDSDYGRAGSFELGGALALAWDADVLAVQARPLFGWFVLDRLELSLFLEAEYLRRTAADGTTSHRSAAAVLLEPSYHHPFAERLAALAGLGLGVGHDGDGFVLEVVPRVGLNILIGSSAVLTPGVRLPVLVGSHLGEAEGDLGVFLRAIVEVGVTTTW